MVHIKMRVKLHFIVKLFPSEMIICNKMLIFSDVLEGFGFLFKTKIEVLRIFLLSEEKLVSFKCLHNCVLQYEMLV